MSALTFDPDYIDFGEVSAPATPSTGNVRVYAKADGKVYRKDDTGAETELGGSSFTGFTLAGGSGTPQAIASGDTVTITGSNGITTSAGATDTITISGSAFIQSFTLAGGSGTPQTINNSNTLTIAGSGGITTSAGATDTVTVDGSAFMQTFTVAGSSGSSQTISNTNTLSILGGTGVTTVASATDTITIFHAWGSDTVLGADGAFDIDITAIPAYSSAKTMVIDFSLRSNVAGATTDICVIQINADATAGNYHWQRAGAQDGVASVTEGNTNVGIIQNVPAGSSPTNSFAGGTMRFFNPFSTTQHKSFMMDSFGRYDTLAYRTDHTGVVWTSVSAITSIRIRTDNHATDLFLAGSYVRVMFIG